ncbi:GAD-like domain protein [Burkholderia contaminans FFH2055]|uniref:GAD-like domain-containing protein n=1 Tax=Burkholderia contaminans TaxID=488447 RepID=UPI0006253194|nr:GAD-like domain-containing protein [Burkholderia contaminans]KKL31652.1 GAD-like domain protein [Burkholderia contaminans FFH2055]MEB4631480.1 GAD-like domain-containing protein [Burkholderia contaminans]MEB4637065.1 GAD-like domain-containing protein [Burkholderia contaminans]MEB4652149.1 GAD-like domain-containing protein [Burkholderia contaminans]MEB4665684.1 GAD-like domain-containing protein [Burkholderia contaminans]
MRDEDFELFIESFGEATSRVEVPQASFEKFEKKLPAQLLKYWAEEGWSSYADGLFWTVNPDEYEDILDMWLEDTIFEEVDSYHVIARTAFGKLYAWGEKTGPSLTVSCPTHSLIALERDLKGPLKNPDFRVQTFFGSKTRNECDLKDEAKAPLFGRALGELGKLGPDEMYGFEPALVAGGQMNLDHLKKVNLDVHLTILRQLAPPKIPFLNIPT